MMNLKLLVTPRRFQMAAVAVAILAAAFFLGGSAAVNGLWSEPTAAWVQGIGVVVAFCISVWLPENQAKRDERSLQERAARLVFLCRQSAFGVVIRLGIVEAEDWGDVLEATHAQSHLRPDVVLEALTRFPAERLDPRRMEYLIELNSLMQKFVDAHCAFFDAIDGFSTSSERRNMRESAEAIAGVYRKFHCVDTEGVNFSHQQRPGPPEVSSSASRKSRPVSAR